MTRYDQFLYFVQDENFPPTREVGYPRIIDVEKTEDFDMVLPSQIHLADAITTIIYHVDKELLTKAYSSDFDFTFRRENVQRKHGDTFTFYREACRGGTGKSEIKVTMREAGTLAVTQEFLYRMEEDGKWVVNSAWTAGRGVVRDPEQCDELGRELALAALAFEWWVKSEGIRFSARIVRHTKDASDNGEAEDKSEDSDEKTLCDGESEAAD